MSLSLSLYRVPARYGLPVLLVVALGGCSLGPAYQRPALQTPAQFHALPGWKPAAPADTEARGPWWQLFGDAELNALMVRFEARNQDLIAAEAAWRQARALVRDSRAALLPSVTGDAGVSRSASGARTDKQYDASLGVRWELDLWGRLRGQVQADRARLAASEADLAALRLSLQSELAQIYLQLRVVDEQIRLLDATLEAFARSLRLSENQYRAGLVPKSDVSQAQTQLQNTRAQRIDLDYQRAQLELALAVLLGEAPAGVRLAPRNGLPALPALPVAVPSQLLERRPDVAGAERRVMAANAEIGVARAAWFPDLSLSAAGGYRGAQLAEWISAPNRVWSIGPQLAMTLFDGGRIRAGVEQAEARYDQTVADYRQTVLEALREVEDRLVQLTVAERETQARRAALEAARESLRLIDSQYRAGTVDYLSVASAQTSALTSERNLLDLQGSQLLASVQLIAALGGGWAGLGEAERD
ncbi:efflux transporter outer membrane subunit [Pseudomonas sp. NW5]|uniref:efflux transporter outer membrane subunit n=1 Tax=Pseudomonas sp. NW5 TaxID=2934934 RepID=UPI00202089AE|nr:efflux transporter outer membrane subunit [Pseudomonas sp. NW5]MCL7463146.1 efflux transporter outer membrane subunit [Pseudomonas sp. NW5]